MYSPKHTLQKWCRQDKLLGSFKVSEHIEHVSSSSLISSTATLSDEALSAISINLKLSCFHNLDNIFVSSFQSNDRIKLSFYKYCQSEGVGLLKIANSEYFGHSRPRSGWVHWHRLDIYRPATRSGVRSNLRSGSILQIIAWHKP
jgi:hypothetical protein